MSTLKTVNIQHPSASTAAMTLNGDGTLGNASFANYPGRNRIINGSFDIWQRGTSFSAISNATYSADRWWVVTDATGTVNVSRQDISSQGLGLNYALRAERSAGTNRWVVGTNLETSDVSKMKGRTVVLSLYVRKGSALTSNVFVNIETKSTEAKFGSAVETAQLVIENSSLSTSSFVRFSKTLTIPSNSSASGFAVEIYANQAGASNAYFDIAGVQLEEGGIPTPFEFKSYGQELRECQRYYWQPNSEIELRTSPTDSSGWLITSQVYFPVTMRTNPILTYTTGSGTPNKVDALNRLGGTVSSAYGLEQYTNTSQDRVTLRFYETAISYAGISLKARLNAEL